MARLRERAPRHIRCISTAAASRATRFLRCSRSRRARSTSAFLSPRRPPPPPPMSTRRSRNIEQRRCLPKAVPQSQSPKTASDGGAGTDIEASCGRPGPWIPIVKVFGRQRKKGELGTERPAEGSRSGRTRTAEGSRTRPFHVPRGQFSCCRSYLPMPWLRQAEKRKSIRAEEGSLVVFSFPMWPETVSQSQLGGCDEGGV